MAVATFANDKCRISGKSYMWTRSGEAALMQKIPLAPAQKPSSIDDSEFVMDQSFVIAFM